MVSVKFSVLQRLVIILTILVKVSKSCPELRECFPDVTVTVPCQGSVSPEWTSEPSETDCSIYVSCFNGIGIQMCCPIGMYYDPNTQNCADEEDVECKIEPPPCPDTTTNNPIETTTTTSAAETTTQNPNTETTDTTSDTDTTTEPITITDETTITTDETTSTESIETTTVKEGADLAALCEALSSDTLVELAYPGECNMYVVCDNRQYVGTESCPAGLHFNPTLSICDSPDHAECLEFVCRNNPEGKQTTVESQNSCQRYFICIGNITVERLCAPGTIYDAKNGWCIVDDVENPCERERLPPPPESVIMQCTGESELSKIPHPTMCDVYYRCLNGNLWVRQCPQGLFFDSDREQCNLAGIVECEVTQQPPLYQI
ncbi:uncharacterized protein LOC128718221 [Anopheles marshallii]|uniref:uncharacterized protein LOC128718221 n=1 Tax=Anopheles marshallii TaxID=1521116 RepID=UPI00237B6871|nr:uncharacterized protein LOC128718221 [Anopheles marshallii]